MHDYQAAYVAGILDSAGGGLGVRFQWNEETSNLIIRGPLMVLEWLEAVTAIPFDRTHNMWAVRGEELHKLLKEVQPHIRIKQDEVAKMIAWMDGQT
jgi:hypothetical protein